MQPSRLQPVTVEPLQNGSLVGFRQLLSSRSSSFRFIYLMKWSMYRAGQLAKIAAMSSIRSSLYLSAAVGISVLLGRKIYISFCQSNRNEIISIPDDIEKEKTSSTEGRNSLSPPCCVEVGTLGDLSPKTGTIVVLSDEYHKLGLRHLVLPAAISPAYLEKLLPMIMVRTAVDNKIL